MNKHIVSIIIPVYKNYGMFFSNLKKNKKFFAGCEVIVMNDFPEEKIADRVRAIIPNAITIDNEKNLGFSSNVNKGVKYSTGEYVLLLNSDTVLIDDLFRNSIKEFEKDKDIFALSFAQSESDKKVVGSNRGFFKNGLINHSSQLNPKPYPLNPCFWAEGGSSIFRKKLLDQLGGFDPLYNPYYWEDVDLSYRAWKTGYKVLFFPEVKVQHFHESTISKYFTKSSVLKIAYRNQFIFNWKNITDQDLLIRHILYLPLLLLRSLITGNLILIKGFFSALVQLPVILKSRQKAVKLFKNGDKEILNLFLNE